MTFRGQGGVIRGSQMGHRSWGVIRSQRGHRSRGHRSPGDHKSGGLLVRWGGSTLRGHREGS